MNTETEVQHNPTQQATQQETIQVNEKQLASVQKIAEGIAARNLGDATPKFNQHKDGQDLVLTADNWPTIKVGKGGGVTVVDLRSYPEGDGKTAIDAAINGDVLLKKQNERDAKKAAQPAAQAAPAAEASASTEEAEATEEALEEEEEEAIESELEEEAEGEDGEEMAASGDEQ